MAVRTMQQRGVALQYKSNSVRSPGWQLSSPYTLAWSSRFTCCVKEEHPKNFCSGREEALVAVLSVHEGHTEKRAAVSEHAAVITNGRPL